MEIDFYFSPMSSAVPVASALAELEVPHRRVTLDLAAGDQRKPEFLALNPNGKVPTLVVDGTPIFEALAILQWLGDHFGVERDLWPAFDSPARATALSWTSWAYVTYGATVFQLYLASAKDAPEALRHPAMAEHTQAELQGLLGLLETRLSEHAFSMGDSFSLVDLSLSSMVMWSRLVGVPTDAHPKVSRWLETCAKRPSIRPQWPELHAA